MLKLCLLVLVSMVAYVYSAAAIYPSEPKPKEFADQEGCYISDLKRVLPYEIPYYPKGEKSCLKYTCQKNNETQFFSCGAIGHPENCRLERDYTLNYPKCCGEVVCNDISTTTTESTTEQPTTETPSTEAPCVTVTEAPSECPTLPRKPKSPKYSKTPESPKAPEKPKAPEYPKTPKIPKTREVGIN